MGFIKYVNGEWIDLIPGQFYHMNASVDRSIEMVRTTMKRIASKPTMEGTPRLILLDEFDYKHDAQGAMKSLMQEYSANTRFIILCNDAKDIIEPIISRCPLKVAQPLTFENVKTLVERIKTKKEFVISPDALEYLYKLTQGDIREFIGKLQDACIISNFDVKIQHLQNVNVDIQTAKSILEAAQINYDSAREVIITTFMKTRDAKDLLEKLYFATYITKFSDNPEDNKNISSRLRDKIADKDFYRTQGTNQLMQLDSIINYVQVLKLIPLKCPKSK
jgi:DNA polymerase III delta prime subunit